MAYVSDVALVLRKNVYEKAMKGAMSNPDDHKYRKLVNSDGTSAIDEVKMNYEYAVLRWEWVSWYGYDEAVKYINELRLNNESYFIRIGENNDDIETELNGEDYDMQSALSLIRCFEANISPIHIGTWNGDKVMEEDPELGEIIQKWYELSKNEGDKGSCVIGAGFNFDYKEKSYFMSACSPWQGSMSWEAHKDDVEKMLINVGAENIRYNWGYMD